MAPTPYFTFDVTAFRGMYPQFADTTAFPTPLLQSYFDAAGGYVANSNYGWLVNAPRFLALNLMTAHLAAIAVLINAGETPGMAVGASVDKVSVTLHPPKDQSQFQWWLNLTGYGQQLLALLLANSAGGFFVGGSNTRGGFRGNSGYTC